MMSLLESGIVEEGVVKRAGETRGLRRARFYDATCGSFGRVCVDGQ